MNIMLKAMQDIDLANNVQDMMEAGEFRVMELTFDGPTIRDTPYITRLDAQKAANERNANLPSPAAFAVRITPCLT